MKKSVPFIIILLTYLLPAVHAQNIINVKEINTSGTGSYPFDFTINTKLYFLAADNSGAYSLWITNGTTSSTKKLSPTGSSISIADIIAYNSKIYFAYDDGVHGYELWVSDGTVAGTKLFKDCYPGSTGSYPQAFTVANNKLFFMGSGVNGERRLYVSDGTPAGTKIIRDNYISLFNGLADFAVLNNDIYFTSNDEVSGGVSCLWKSNGTAAGTKAVSCDLIPGVNGCNYAALNNQLYFSGFDYVNGSELWVTNGTNAGTHIVKNLSADGGGVLNSGAPNNLIVYNSKVYFEAKDDLHGVELFSTDGTAANTKLVKDIVPGIGNSSPYESILFNGLLYFVCLNTQELWKTNGTAAGTKVVKGGLPNARIGNKWNNKLYLIVDNDYAVWESDGTTTGTIPIHLNNTSNPVYSLNNGFQFIPFKGGLYFSGSCNGITVGYELCKLSTTATLLTASPDDKGLALQPAEEKMNNLTATYHAAGKEIIISNNSNSACNWQLFSTTGALLKKGKSAGVTTRIATPGIAPGVYFLICESALTTEKIKLVLY